MSKMVDSAVGVVVSQTNANATAAGGIAGVAALFLVASDLSPAWIAAWIALITWAAGGGVMSLIRGLRAGMIEAGIVKGAHK